MPASLAPTARAAILEEHRSGKTLFYPEAEFGGFTETDGTVAFYSRVNALARPSFSILDYGCGRGNFTEDPIDFRRNLRCFKGRVAKVIGVDVDGMGSLNPSLDEFRILERNRRWPLETRCVDLVIADCVLEHLADPPAFFHEARRVLVPGGYLCIRTPNVFSYFGLVSKLLPSRCHSALASRVQAGRKKEDVFATHYRCNTLWTLRRQMKANGFRAVVYGYEPEPGYLEWSTVAYALGVLHQKFAPGFLRVSIFAFGRLE